jgi:hypothetical protein
MAAAWNRYAADDGASNLWLRSSGSLRVTLVVPRRRAGRHQRKCKHNGRNNGYDCFHASAPRALVDCTVAVSADGLVEHDVNLRRSDRVGPRANRRNAAPECPLWVAGSTGRRNTCVKSPPMWGYLAQMEDDGLLNARPTALSEPPSLPAIP